MTDFSDDELVSAVLDGEATDDDVARVHADPALSARLAELRVASEALSSPVAFPAASARDGAVAEALRAAPTDLGHRRALRRRRTVRLVSIAAAVLVAVGVVGGLIASSRHDSTRATTSAAWASDSSGSSAAALPLSPSADRAAPSNGVASGDLGAFSTRADLVDAVRRLSALATETGGVPAGTQDATSAVPSGSEFAPAAACPPPSPGTEFSGSAVLDGQPVVVIVRDEQQGRVLEVRDAACVLVFSETL